MAAGRVRISRGSRYRHDGRGRYNCGLTKSQVFRSPTMGKRVMNSRKTLRTNRKRIRKNRKHKARSVKKFKK